MKKSYLMVLTFILCLVFVLCCFPVLGAQENDFYEFTLEEITVTAEKREANVQDVAASVTAITGADMRDKAQTTLDSVLSDVAGLKIGGASAGSVITIRGVASLLDTEQADPSTAIMVDGVYSERAEKVMSAMFDMERVEVLRGPQGTLYGRNAIGGIVNLVSKSPTDKFEATGNFQIGEYNLKHFDGALNIPLSDKVTGRLAFMRDLRDGYLSNGQNNSDKLSFRSKLSYKPNERLSFLAAIEINEDNSQIMTTVPVPGSAGNLPDISWVDEFDYEAGWGLPIGSDPWTQDEWHPFDWYVFHHVFTTYSIQMDWDLEWGKFMFLPSYTETKREVFGDSMCGTAKTYNQTEVRVQRGTLWSGEARLTSPTYSAFDWIVGLYVQQSENRDNIYDKNIQTFTLDTTGSWQFSTVREPGFVSAVFGQITYPVTDRFRLSGGVRYNQDTRKLSYRFGNGNITDPTDPYYDLATVNAEGYREYTSPLLTYDTSISEYTYKGGIEYDVSEDSMLYAQISSGFKAGGLNNTAPPTTYDPEKLISYEIGSKNYFLDKRLMVNIGAYYYDYEDMQIMIRSEVDVGDTGEEGYGSIILNAKNGKNSGLEIETDYLVTPDDILKASFTYMQTEYGKTTYPSYVDVLAGQDMVNAPTWSGTLGYQHSWDLDDGAQISASFNTKLSDGYYTTVEQVDGRWQDSYHRSEAYVNYYSASGRWSSGLWMKNIENDAQTTFVMGFYRRKITDPRTFGMNISFTF